jgi:microcystin-dependent protein
VAYTKYNADWKDYPDTTTPITQAALDHIETGVYNAHTLVDDHVADTLDAHDASAISILDTANDFTATDVEGALAELQSDAEAHLADTVDAHDASAISFVPTGTISSTDVQAAIAEVASEAAGGTPTGAILAYGGISAPTGYLLCDGTAYARASYAALFSALTLSKGTFTVTIATPAVFTLTSHGLKVNDKVYFTTTGALPTGLSVDTIYYIISAGLTASDFQVSTTRGGTAVNTSGTQSGTHTCVLAPWGGVTGTDFTVPDLRGRMPAGYGSAGHADVASLGDSDQVTLANRRPKHKHTVGGGASGLTGSGTQIPDTGAGNYNVSAITVGTSTDNADAPAFAVVNYIVKT